MTVKELTAEARKLSRAGQAELLDALIILFHEHSLILTPTQQQDLDRRIDEYRSGRAKMIPGDEALARLRNRL